MRCELENCVLQISSRLLRRVLPRHHIIQLGIVLDLLQLNLLDLTDKSLDLVFDSCHTEGKGGWVSFLGSELLFGVDDGFGEG